MKIYYGSKTHYIDVTDICHIQLKKNNIITIPHGDDNRTNYFTDPIFGIVKSIFIVSEGNVQEYNNHHTVKINFSDNTITSEPDASIKLEKIHSTLQLKYGTFADELPEQKMAVRYLTGNEKVLEIGGNIGRNSCIIGRILNHSDFVTMECDQAIALQLIENRDLNKLTFHVENSALSKHKLIQKGWDTMPSDILLDGYNWVQTITYEQLKIKYPIQFDTLILDCEGAFYYILKDMPEILDNIKLIIMENDYHDYSHKEDVDDILHQKGFKVDYSEAGGWGPCYVHFFEVWKR